jgi:hypothetical protein
MMVVAFCWRFLTGKGTLDAGGFYVNGKNYDSERSNALPLVRGLLEPWTHGTGGWHFQQMEYGS